MTLLVPDAARIQDQIDNFKGAMRRLAAAVSIVTTNHQGIRFGMTATAVMSLSMDPPSLAVAINRNASIYPALKARRAFCVNLLHEQHAALCRHFSTAPAAERFLAGSWGDEVDGLPCLKDSEASIVCSLGPTLEYGSHTIFVGEVRHTILGGSFTPLVYLNGTAVAVRGP